MRIERYEEIPLDQLKIGLSQARVRDVSKDIDDLARSIGKLGLLEPIVVAPSQDGGYEVVTGQRRFLAVTKLGWTSIRAGVLDEMPNGDMAKAISLTENMVRLEMSEKDYIDACTELFRHYGSIKAVSDELGLPQNRVSKYVKFEQLSGELKDKVTEGNVKLDVALRAQRAATRDGNVDQELALALAEEMSNMATVQQKQLEKVATQDPTSSLEEILEAGRKQAKVKNLTITISEDVDGALASYAQEEGSDKNDAAASLIFSGLQEKGYVDDE